MYWHWHWQLFSVLRNSSPRSPSCCCPFPSPSPLDLPSDLRPLTSDFSPTPGFSGNSPLQRRGARSEPRRNELLGALLPRRLRVGIQGGRISTERDLGTRTRDHEACARRTPHDARCTMPTSPTPLATRYGLLRPTARREIGRRRGGWRGGEMER